MEGKPPERLVPGRERDGKPQDMGEEKSISF
jgi:hypothetical protein